MTFTHRARTPDIQHLAATRSQTREQACEGREQGGGRDRWRRGQDSQRRPGITEDLRTDCLPDRIPPSIGQETQVQDHHTDHNSCSDPILLINTFQLPPLLRLS